MLRRRHRHRVLGVRGKSDSGPDGAASPDDLDQYGRGEYDEASGTWEWYDIPPEALAQKQAQDRGEIVTLTDLFAQHWKHVEADLHDCYGIDIEDTNLMGSRTWRWLKVRILGLVTKTGTRTHTAIVAAQPAAKGGGPVEP